MGYRKERIGSCGSEVEYRVYEYADLAQLLPTKNKMVMIDKKDLAKATNGETIFAMIYDLSTGNIDSSNYYKLPLECSPEYWVECRKPFERTYTYEKDYS